VGVEEPNETHRGRVQNPDLAVDTAERNEVQLSRVVNAVDRLDLLLLHLFALQTSQGVFPDLAHLSFQPLFFLPLYVRDLLLGAPGLHVLFRLGLARGLLQNRIRGFFGGEQFS